MPMKNMPLLARLMMGLKVTSVVWSCLTMSLAAALYHDGKGYGKLFCFRFTQMLMLMWYRQ